MRGEDLLESAAARLGLSTVVGVGLLRRALRDARIRPEEAQVNDLLTALPRVRLRLASHLTTPAAVAAMDDLETMLRASLPGVTDTGSAAPARGPLSRSGVRYRSAKTDP